MMVHKKLMITNLTMSRIIVIFLPIFQILQNSNNLVFCKKIIQFVKSYYLWQVFMPNLKVEIKS